MKKNKKYVLIAGAGDVGKSLAQILKKKYNIYFIDRNYSGKFSNINFDVLHICFPYNKKFINSTVLYIKQFKPRLTIINSTVAVGTTQKIIKRVKSQAVVHSPIIGDHNKLTLGISTFTKIIGAGNSYYARCVSDHFKSVGFKTQIFKDAKTTELGKLLLTTQFALNIAFHQEMKRMCDKTDIDFDKTINQIKKIFNAGYFKIRPNVVLPNLFPGKISGSCLMQNIEILHQYYQSEFLVAIKNSDDKKKK